MISYTKKCRECGNEFTPKDPRGIFCTRSCGARWKMKQPEIVSRMITNKDLEKAGRAISRGIRKNKKDMARRRMTGLKLKRKSWQSSMQQPTWHEQRVLELFPESQWGFTVRTGDSAKQGFVGYYKLDVAWPIAKLDVEIDGSTHDSAEQKIKDRERTKFLERQGWSVLRFTNRQVKYELPKVRSAIESTLSRLRGILHIQSTVA